MTASELILIAAAVATAILLIAAAINDIVRYRIPNLIVYAIAAAFVVGAIAHFSWPMLAWSVFAAVCMFLLGAVFFALGLFGGGDVKLIAVVALWTGIADLPRFVLVMSAVGGGLGLIWMIRRMQHRHRVAKQSAETAAAASVAPTRSFKLPYGVAIALAGLDFFVTSPRSPFAHYIPWIL